VDEEGARIEGRQEMKKGIFAKGKYQPISPIFRTEGLSVLAQLSDFQDKFQIPDTDTTINAIRDSLIANYLGYDLLNIDKHGFDARKSKKEEFLEIKQCSFSSTSWGGTWNDTNEEKARAFSDKRLFTAVAVWKNASDLQFIVYGQNKNLGADMLSLIRKRKSGSRSTQKFSIVKLIKDYKFQVICAPDKDSSFVYNLLIAHNKNFANILRKNEISRL
jgi:hypothetical protein